MNNTNNQLADLFNSLTKLAQTEKYDKFGFSREHVELLVTRWKVYSDKLGKTPKERKEVLLLEDPIFEIIEGMKVKKDKSLYGALILEFFEQLRSNDFVSKEVCERWKDFVNKELQN